MKTRVIGPLAFVLAVSLSSAVGTAQTLTELLQKGIYTQETLGDVDGAIKIYQQVIASAAQAAEIRAQAERRLKQLQAAQAQRRLPMLPSFSPYLQPPPPAPAVAEPRGTFDGKTYRHTWSGTTFAVPEGWTAHDTFESSGGGEMTGFMSKDPAALVNVWMIKEETDREGVITKLDNAPILKVGDRQGFTGWHYREGSTQRVYIGGHQAVVATADFTEGSQKMAEYMTWIYTEHSRVFFFVRLPADQLDQIRPQVDQMVYSAVIP